MTARPISRPRVSVKHFRGIAALNIFGLFTNHLVN
jgi:hypothetical protein